VVLRLVICQTAEILAERVAVNREHRLERALGEICRSGWVRQQKNSEPQPRLAQRLLRCRAPMPPCGSFSTPSSRGPFVHRKDRAENAGPSWSRLRRRPCSGWCGRNLAPDGLEAWAQVIERGYEGYAAKDEASAWIHRTLFEM